MKSWTFCPCVMPANAAYCRPTKTPACRDGDQEAGLTVRETERRERSIAFSGKTIRIRAGGVTRTSWRSDFRELGTVPEIDQWDTWNMGIGIVVMLPAEDAATALRVVPGAVEIGRVEAASGPRRVRWA